MLWLAFAALLWCAAAVGPAALQLTTTGWTNDSAPVSLPFYFPSIGHPSHTFKLRMDNLLGVIELPAQYLMSFDLMRLAETNAQNKLYTSVVHLSASSTDDSSRIPGVFFYPDDLADVKASDERTCSHSQLSLSYYQELTNYVYFCEPALPIDVWTTVTVVIDTKNQNMFLVENGISWQSNSIKLGLSITTFPKVFVYGSDPWNPAAPAEIRKFEVSAPLNLPVAFFSGESGFNLTTCNLIGLVALPSKYTVSFELKTRADRRTGWRNIIQLAANGDVNQNSGSRLPLVELCQGETACPTGALSIIHRDNNQVSRITTPFIPQIDVWYNLNITIDFDLLAMTFALLE